MGDNPTQPINIGNTIPVGSTAVNVQIMFVAGSDEEAIAVKRRLQDALAGIRVIRNTVTLSDMPATMKA